VEHSRYSGGAFVIENAVTGHIQSVHIEGTDVTAADQAYCVFDKASITIENLSIINQRMSYDGVAMIELGEANSNYAVTNKKEVSTLDIGNYFVIGLAAPNGPIYPDYPSGQVGLENIADFAHVRRSNTYTDRDYRLRVKNYSWGAYNSRSASVPFYKFAWEKYSNANDNIDLLQWDKLGKEVHPRPNLLQNGAFDTWVNTAPGAVSTMTETATKWFVDSGAGNVTPTQQLEDYGADDNAYFLRVDASDGVNTFSRIRYDIDDIYDFRKCLDRPILFSFEARSDTAGQFLSQIALSIRTDSGFFFNQIIAGAANLSVAAADTWEKFWFVGEIASSSIPAGANPRLELNMEINGSTNARNIVLDVRKIKLEQGEHPSDFIRHWND
jgi:hypothetical protein